jgi:malate dehydrogenase (oxaloacetate-decarboxylating)
VLIGTSARGGAFTEDVIRDMAAHTDRPVIMPMSNPTELAEASPADLIHWTGGTALVAAGSPFAPVEYRGTTYAIGQANNALVFPGLGLGAIAVRAAEITDGMLAAAAHAVARLVDTAAAGAALLPEMAALRDTSLAVAVAVADAAIADGVAASKIPDDLPGHVEALRWQPAYRPVRPA